MRANVVLGLVAIGCSLGISCASQKEVFIPVGQSVASVHGAPSARYALPGGSVLLVPLPMRTVREQELIGVRMIVDNESGPMPWLVDAREQSIVPGPSEMEAPDPKADIVVNRSGSSVVTVPPGEKETIDLYFPPPPRPPAAPALRELSMHWRIQAGDTAIAHQTNLYRATLEPVWGLDSDYGQALGQNWNDPDWAIAEPFQPPLIVKWRVKTPSP
ncbi:MAG TPA: hypothetical protein VJT73_12080 [Polyangiaceae bacterium]|nr:hypothetical protein [Polyangiaceae bacterium]